MALVSWRSSEPPAGTRTSELLATGEPASGEILDVRTTGGFLDARPMVQFLVRVRTAEAPELEIVVIQSVPRRMLAEMTPGTSVELRLSPDRAAAAIVLG